jgi:surface antigen
MISAMTAILIGSGVSGCSVMRNDGPFAKMDSVEVTGSIHAPTHSGAKHEPTDADLALARMAASDVLTQGAKDSSQPWENPASGAHGSVTPVAASYTEDGRVCRNFLASYVWEHSESWMEGAACRSVSGQWEIRSLKPWRRG